jgi:hypothetical protein
MEKGWIGERSFKTTKNQTNFSTISCKGSFFFSFLEDCLIRRKREKENCSSQWWSNVFGAGVIDR